jgi:hypothetical protein
VYCSVIDACIEVFDLRRAHEWTAALSRWCERQPDSVPYRGTCMVRRAEIMKLHGSWADAMDEAARACERLLVPPPRPGAGQAAYQCGSCTDSVAISRRPKRRISRRRSGEPGRSLVSLVTARAGRCRCGGGVVAAHCGRHARHAR